MFDANEFVRRLRSGELDGTLNQELAALTPEELDQVVEELWSPKANENPDDTSIRP